MLRNALLAKLGVSGDIKKPKLPKKSSPSPKKTKSKRLSKSHIFEEFDDEIRELEAKFRVNAQIAKKAVQGLVTLTSTNPKLKNQLFDDDQFPLFVQINSIKVPKGHSKIVRIPLKHSILTADSEVCLIVPDVKGIPNKNHEEHLERYEKLLSDKGVTCIKKIMTFHEFRTEYETFELKNRLVELYDVFLVDGKISGKTVKKCGKIFYKKRKVPTAIKLQATRLKEHVEATLRKTPLYLHAKGDSFTVQVGHSKMDKREVVENIFYLLRGLNKEFPGGFANVRNLNLYAFRGLTFPIYTTLKNKNKVSVPDDIIKEPTVEEYTDELSTKLHTGVTVKATGEVIVFPLDEKDDDEEQKEPAGDNREKSGVNSVQVKVQKKKSNDSTENKKRKLKKDDISAKDKSKDVVPKNKRKIGQKESKTVQLKKKKQKLNVE